VAFGLGRCVERRLEAKSIERGHVTPSGLASPSLPTLIDMPTAAEHLGVSLRRVRRLVAEKRIPYVKVGHYVRFDPVQLLRWIDEHRVEASSTRRGG
jgi:excisionase family DNA binding protein